MQKKWMRDIDFKLQKYVLINDITMLDANARKWVYQLQFQWFRCYTAFYVIKISYCVKAQGTE